MKILIIDDSEDDRLLYRRTLQKDTQAIYEILDAADGAEGLKQLQNDAPECILLDYSLPGHNGIEVLKRIREQNHFVPVVMMTGQGNEAVAVQAIHEGAQNYITKSTITPETLRHVVHAAIEHCEMEQHIHDQQDALEIFTRALAHDLKEPIRTIKSFLELLAGHENFSEEERGYFHYIQNAADRMGALVETVYFYTRLDGEPQHIAEDVCDIGVVLQEVCANIKQLMDERSAIITSDNLPKTHINHTHLLQVLQNLICNAIHHCHVPPRIHICAKQRANDWLLQVADNGPGIAEAYRTQIFEPFKRIGHNGGLGLGLAVCKKIVESYGGKIWYEPGPEGGSIFVFTLPLETFGTADTLVPATNIIAHNVLSEPASEAVARIMLVEDNEADVRLAEILLIKREKLRCDFTVARDGLEALDILQTKNGVDLMLLDINMPGMDGFTLMEKLQTEPALRHIPVVICSTSTDDQDMKRAKSLGAIGYLSKPPGIDKLKPLIEQMPNIHLHKADDGYILLRTA